MRIYFRSCLLPLILAGLFLTTCGEEPATPAETELSIQNAWVRATPPGVRVTAAYFELHNPGNTDARLLRASTDVAGRVEIHETQMDAEGVMRMRPLPDGLAIPAGQSIALQPGGIHLMLLELNREPAAGETLQLSLEFADGQKRSIEAEVRQAN